MEIDRPSYAIPAGDLEPPLRARLVQGNKRPLPSLELPSTAITWVMWAVFPGGPTIFGTAYHWREGGIGWVAYDWSPGETDVPGLYRGRFRVVYSGDRPQSVPSDGYIDVEILPNPIPPPPPPVV